MAIEIEQHDEVVKNRTDFTDGGLIELKESIDIPFLTSIGKLINYIQDENNLDGEISKLAIQKLTNSLQKLYSSKEGGDRDREMLHFMAIFQELNKEIVARPNADNDKPKWTIFRDMTKEMFYDFTFSDTRIQKEKETDKLKPKIELQSLKSKEEYLLTIEGSDLMH